MTLFLVLCSLAATPVTTDDIVAAWKRNAGEIASATVELKIERDSRDRTFGQQVPEAKRPVAHLHFDDSLRRLDVPRRTATRHDGRTQPAEADPDRARIEFRNVLLEEHLAGPQMVPTIQPASVIIDLAGQQFGQRLAPLDQLLAEGPLWSARTLWLVKDDPLAVVGNADDRTVKLITRAGSDSETVLWIEPQAPHRPLRIVHRNASRPVAQVDLTYSDQAAVYPSRWFVQTLGPAGESLDFAEATLGRVEPLTNLLPAALLELQQQPNSDQPRLPGSTAVRVRSSLRRALDSRWLPGGVIGLLLLAGLLRGSRVRSRLS